jgi:F0F1-type ATP synthase membrane subunit c/vacuolar-type H+-ATPase subunit K
MATSDIVALVSIIMTALSSSTAAAYAIVTAGTAMAGAGTERPEILGKAIIAIVLAEAIAIYGLLTSFMLISSLPLITDMTLAWRAFSAAIIMSATSVIAGLSIARVGSVIAGAAAEKPETYSKNVIAVVLAEAIAIYGLLMSFMLIGTI